MTTPAEAAPATLPNARVHGTVTAAGQPLGGVRLRLGTAGKTREATSRPDGSFELDSIPPGAYALAAEAVGRSLGAFLPVDVGLAVGAEQPSLAVELVPTVALVGLIRDETGKPLAGAWVGVEEEQRPLPITVETGADGRFSVANRIKGQSYRVLIRRAGYLPEGPRSVRAGGPPLELGMRRGAILEGQVVDEAGAPVVGAEISVVGEEGGGESLLIPAAAATASTGAPDGWARLESSGELGVLRGPIPFPTPGSAPTAGGTVRTTVASTLPRSDGRGQFRVAELPPGSALVTARHPDFADATSVPVQLASGAPRQVRLELRRGSTVLGRVVDDLGHGIADAQISTNDGRTALSDARGRFQIEHVLRRITLTARQSGYLRGEGVAEPEPGQRELEVEIALRRALGRLIGEVLDPRGNAVVGAKISVVPNGAEGLRVVSGSDGRFRAEGLANGPYRVVVEHPEYARLLLPSIEASDDARLLLRYGGGIDGELFDPRTGNAPEGARLEATGGDEHRTIPLDGRRFRATGLPVGSVRLQASARGYPTLVVDVEVTESDRPSEITVRDLRLELELGGQVRGRVRDAHGDPIVGAAVDFARTRGTASTVTDARGEFYLAGAPTGRVVLRARWQGRAVEEEVEIRANEESRVDLTLPEAGP